MSENETTVKTFDPKPLTSLVTKKVKLQKKMEELLKLESVLPEEIDKATKNLDPTNSKGMDTLLILKTRLECLPDKITETDREIAQVNADLESLLVEAGAYLETIWATDNERVLSAAIQALQPFCTSSAEARNIAGSLPRIAMLANSVRSVLYATDAEGKARMVLDLLKRYQEAGTLIPADVLVLLPMNSETKN